MSIVFSLLSFLAFWQVFAAHATSPSSPFATNPYLQKAASLLHSFQEQTQASEDKKNRLLPAHLTKDLYTAGQIVTGQGGAQFDTDPLRYANEQEKRLYLTIAFTTGIDLAARWQFIPCHDIAVYFEQSFGFKEGYLQHLQPETLQSNRPHQHCFLMTLAAFVAYQAVVRNISTAFMNAQAHYVSLKNVIMINRGWLEALLDSIQKENHALYPALVKIYACKSNLYYILIEKGDEKVLDVSPKPLHFTRFTPLILTPWSPSFAAQLKDILGDSRLSLATINDFSHKIRNAGFIVTSLEEAQSIFIALWLYNPSKDTIEALLQGLDQDLYNAFSEDRKTQTLSPTSYSGISVVLNQTKINFPNDKEEKDPPLFLQIAGGRSNFIDDS